MPTAGVPMGVAKRETCQIYIFVPRKTRSTETTCRAKEDMLEMTHGDAMEEREICW